MLDFDNRDLFDEKGSLLTKRNNDQINSYNTDYKMIVGRRSNGKTYPTTTFDGIKKFIDSGYKDSFAYLRRYDTDLKTCKDDLFNGVIKNGWLQWYSKGAWNNIFYYRGKWYLRKLDENGKVLKKCNEPLAYAFALNLAERYKGPDYPSIKTIIFDEFIPEKGKYGYAPGEWRLFLSVISSIVRERGDIPIYMIANTISKNCLYFEKFGIDIDKVDQGTIEVRTYKSGGTLALEYCKDSEDTTIDSTKYFDIDDSNTGEMITSGAWQTGEYPKLPKIFRKYKDLTQQIFFVIQGKKVIQGNIFVTSELSMIYFHKKTTPIKYDSDLVYFDKYDNAFMHMYNRRIGFNPRYKLDAYIVEKISHNGCYYQDNDVGETIKYFLENT